MPFPLPPSDSGSATSACPERNQRRALSVSSVVNNPPAPISAPISAHSASSAISAFSFLTLNSKLSALNCPSSLTPIIPTHTRPPGRGDIPVPWSDHTQRDAKRNCLFRHPERSSLTFSPAPHLGASGCAERDRGNQPCPTQTDGKRSTSKGESQWPSTTFTYSPAPPGSSTPASPTSWSAVSASTKRNSSTGSRSNTTSRAWCTTNRTASPSRQSAAKSKSKAGA